MTAAGFEVDAPDYLKAPLTSRVVLMLESPPAQLRCSSWHLKLNLCKTSHYWSASSKIAFEAKDPSRRRA